MSEKKIKQLGISIFIGLKKMRAKKNNIFSI